MQGIHVLLNNCPKLTHLSLTGVQAFLRDELLAFCREAPPEFNDHQRDVFCVFSGGGVARLREYLNDQKRQAVAAGSVTPSVESDTGIDLDLDADGDVPDSDGSTTPVLLVDVHGAHPQGATPIVPGPSSGLLFANILQNQTAWPHNQHSSNHAGHANAGSSSLSQSAPASTGGPWGQGPIAPPPPPPMHGNGGGGGGGGGAQHVTGMMGATILDDVDEGDEAFGEGSEIMGD